nr:putative ribonuclease H-like domain-containing protein [Tanacetum cinerariifolium]
MYCLIVTDDYSRFTWVFFLATKNETSGILKSCITRIENLVDTQDHLGIINGKADEGFIVRYSLNSKAFRVFNSKTRIVEENLHISSTVNTAGTNGVNVVGENISIELQFDPNMPALEDVIIFDFLSDDEDNGAVADINNLDTTIQVMSISVILVYSNSLEGSVGHLLDELSYYTPASPDYLPASDTEFDPSKDLSSDHIPTLPATSPILSSNDNSSGSDIPDTPPSPTHVMVLASGQSIPHGRPYRYHFNGSVHMMTVRKRVGLMPTHHLAVRHSVDYSSSDHFSSNDSSSSSSSKTSSDALSDSALICSSSDHSLPTSSSGRRPSHHLCSLVPSTHRSSIDYERPSDDSSSASPSYKRSRPPAVSVLLSSPKPEALSYARAGILPSPKRIRSPQSVTDLEECLEHSFEPYVPRAVGFGVDFEDTRIEPSRDKGIDARVIVEAIDREEIEMSMRGLVEVRVDRVTNPVVADDIIEPAQEGAIDVTYETLGDLVKRIVATGWQSADMLERIQELEQDNRRLRDMMDVDNQRVRVLPYFGVGSSVCRGS